MPDLWFFWPGITCDIEATRAQCADCNRYAPSQAHLPPNPDLPPRVPFDKVYADFFEYAGKRYLIIGDRFSGWTEIYPFSASSTLPGANGLIQCLRLFLATYGLPSELSSDGGPEFAASVTKQFLRKWGITHRVSSAYFARSNGRAEVGVKSSKRLLRSNVGANGSINNDKFLQAIWQLRNTPDPECGVSPSQLLFGQPITDTLAFTRESLNAHGDPMVMCPEAWNRKEATLIKRQGESNSRLNNTARSLGPLREGDRCYVQTQHGNRAKRWERLCTVLRVLPHDKYDVIIDGSTGTTQRNRKFLRRCKPNSPAVRQPSPVQQPPQLVQRHQLVQQPQLAQKHQLVQQPPPVQPHIDDSSSSQPQQLDDGATQSATRTPASLLRRLLPHNASGLGEDVALPTSRLRPRNRTPAAELVGDVQ